MINNEVFIIKNGLLCLIFDNLLEKINVNRYLMNKSKMTINFLIMIKSIIIYIKNILLDLYFKLRVGENLMKI